MNYILYFEMINTYSISTFIYYTQVYMIWKIMEIKRPLCKNCIHSFLFTFIVKVFTVLLHLCRIQNSIWKAKGLYQIATFCLAFNLILQYLKIFCDYYKFIIPDLCRKTSHFSLLIHLLSFLFLFHIFISISIQMRVLLCWYHGWNVV